MRPKLFACVLVAALPIAACGGSDDPAGETPGTATGTEEITLRVTWWGNPDRAEATQDAIALFEAEYPHVTVDVSPSSFSGYYDKLNTQFASGAAPDVFQNDQVTTYVAQELLLNLDDYSHILDTSAIDDGFLNQARVDGTLYEVPAGSSPMALVYRQASFDAAGLDTPSNELTWEEFAQLARDLQPTLEDGWALADSSTLHNHFQVFIRQRDRDWFSADGSALGFTTDDLAEWWAYWADLRTDGAVPPADVTVGQAGGDVTESPLAQGLVAMSIYGTAVTLPTDDMSYGALPNEAGNPGAYLMRANSWAVNAATDHPDEAVELINFLINDPEAGHALGMTRGVPPNPDIAAGIREDLDDKEQDIAAYVEYLSAEGNSGPAPAPDPAGTRNIRSEMFERYAQEVLFGQRDPAEAAEAFVNEAEQLIAANN
jgi:multiple sugar transport system substrate-binding protein